MSKSMAEIQDNLAHFEPVELREQVTRSWALEPTAKTQDDVAEIMRMQFPFHFASVTSEAYRRFVASEQSAIYAPEVLSYTAAHEYAMEFEDQLRNITRPTLIMTGEHDRTTTPRAARDLHAGISGSELVIVPDAGHMAYVEQPRLYFAAIHDFFARHPVSAT
jgi:pimeloyl-ACP methyl ester carboxylesterase